MLQTAAEVDRALDDVLALPEFASNAPSPVGRWISEALRRVAELLRGFFPDFSLEGADAGTMLSRIAMALLAAGASVLAYRAVRRWRFRRRVPGGARARPAAAAPVPTSAEEWEARAFALAAAGSWKEAAMALYQSVLHALEARGAVRLDPAKTPGDYRRESRRHPESHRYLDSFLRRLEPVVFGVDAADARSFGLLVEASGARGATVDG